MSKRMIQTIVRVAIFIIMGITTIGVIVGGIGTTVTYFTYTPDDDFLYQIFVFVLGISSLILGVVIGFFSQFNKLIDSVSKYS